MNSKRKRTNRGASLIVAIVAVFLLALLAMSSLLAASAGSHMSGHRRDSQQAFDIAEAGFENAYRTLVDSGSYKGQSNVAFGGGWFTTATSPGPTGGSIQVVSKGSVLGGEGIYATRTISGLIETGQLNQLLGYAVITKSSLSLGGSTSVTSSPTSGVGDIYSNGNISLNGAVSIAGSASAAGTISTTGHAGAQGGMTQNASPVTFPPIDQAALQKEAAVNGTKNGNVQIAAGTSATVQGVINGDLTLGSNAGITLNGVVFVTGNLQLSGGSYSGAGTLVVEGTITMHGQNSLAAPDTSRLSIVDLSTSSSAVDLTGGASLGGFLYVPNGGVTIVGGAGIFGAVAANTMTFKGNSNVTRNTAQQPPIGLSNPTIAYWNDETGT